MHYFILILLLWNPEKTGFKAELKIATSTLSHSRQWAKFEMMWLWITTIRQMGSNEECLLLRQAFCLLWRAAAVGCWHVEKVWLYVTRKKTKFSRGARCHMAKITSFISYKNVFFFNSLFISLFFIWYSFLFNPVFFSQHTGSVLQKRTLSVIKIWSYLLEIKCYFKFVIVKSLFIKFTNLIREI